MDLSVPAANSALQRARATVQQHSADQLTEAAGSPTDDEQRLLDLFIETHERGDVEGSLAVLREDVRVTMPPNPFLYEGRDAVLQLMNDAFDRSQFEEWRLVPAWANRQPAAVSYARLPGDSMLRPFKIDVLRVEDGLIAEVTTFHGRLHTAFETPEVLTT